MATVAKLLLDIEANTAGLQRSVDQTAGVMTRLENTARTVGTAMAGAFSISAIANMAKDVTDAASSVQDAADKIGISAEAVQKLGFAAEQGGASIDSVGRAIKTMASHLNDPSAGAAAAMEALGLDLAQLQAMSPDQAFLAMADAIKQVPDPLKQSAYATDLLGKSGVELLPAIKAGFQSIADTAPVMSNATVKAADDMGDAWQKTQQQIDVLKAQALTPLLETFMEMPASVQVGVGALAQFAPVLSNVGMAVMASGGPIAAFGMLKTALMSLSTLLTLPAGAVVAAIVGLVLVFQHWDQISAIAGRVYAAVKDFMFDKLGAVFTGIKSAVMAVANFYKTIWLETIPGYAKAVYEGIKVWLLDKFQAVVDGIKAKVGAVTGFFRDMYEAVVGHSYVPDMVDGIASHFGRLQTVMVAPAAAAAQQTSGVFGSLKNAVMGSLGDLNRIFQSAFEGGGGLSGAVKSMATNVVATLTSMIPVVGPIISQFSGAIVAGLMKLKDDIGSIVKGIATVWLEIQTFGLFGGFGPSKAEKEGREAAEAFREQLAGMLTDVQALEAGNERWKQSVIVVRDAYMAAGKSEQDALAIMDKLWKAEKQGGDAVRKVMEEIQAVLNAGLTPAATGFGTAMTDATTGATNGLNAMGAAAQVIKDQIAQPIVIPIEFEWSDAERKAKSSGRTGLGPEDFESKEEWSKYFLANNPGDEHRIDSAYGSTGGSMHTGGVVDFAKWKRAHTGMLAHDEVPMVLQAGEGVIRKEAMSLVGGAAGIEALNRGRGGGGMDATGIQARQDQQTVELAALRRELRALPTAIKTAMQDAAALAPRRRAS